MMHILIIGGNGRTGQLVIQKAISQGHQVTALVRKAASLQPRDDLIIVEGSPTNISDIDRAFLAGPDTSPTASNAVNAVVVTLNARRLSDSPFSAPSPDTPKRLMADSVANTITSMKKHGISKIVIMSSLGTGSSFASLNFLMKLVFTMTSMKYQMEDHNAVDDETRQSGVDFVLVRPAMLTEGAEAAVKVHGDDGQGGGFMPKISRASVANFIVNAVQGSGFIGRSPVISN